MRSPIPIAAATNDTDPQLFGGLPQYVIPSSGAKTSTVHSAKIVTACNLPPSAGALPRVAALIAQAAEANGLKVETRKSCYEMASLPNLTVQAVQR